jgi:hypothetical protein
LRRSKLSTKGSSAPRRRRRKRKKEEEKEEEELHQHVSTPVLSQI